MINGQFRVYSNYREIAAFDTLDAAKEFAVKESSKFDDIMRIENGYTLYFAQYSVLYRAHVIR